MFATSIGRRVAVPPDTGGDATPRFPGNRRRVRAAGNGSHRRIAAASIAVAAASNLRLGQRAIFVIVRDHVRVLDDQQRIVRGVRGVDAVVQRVGEATESGVHAIIRAGDSHTARSFGEGAGDQRGIVRGSFVHLDRHGRVGDDGDGVEADHLRRGYEEACGVFGIRGARRWWPAARCSGAGSRSCAANSERGRLCRRSGFPFPFRSIVGVARVGGRDDDAAHRV